MLADDLERIETRLASVRASAALADAIDRPLYGDEPSQADMGFAPAVLSILKDMDTMVARAIEGTFSTTPEQYREPLRRAIMAGDVEEIDRIHVEMGVR